ncbi:MAG: ferrochelatase [Acidobacteriales bacterium]|nr:ferrochelatase [Terriglobales bacterium]
MSSRTAVLLLAHGSPESAADVPEFMRLITGGRQLPQAALEEIRRRYELIGRSPLLDITLRQAQLLQRKLALPVYIGMRNWKPFIAQAVEKMAADGIERAAVICLAPQNSRTSVGLYRKALESAVANIHIEIEFVESWHDHPQLIRAFAERLDAAWRVTCATFGKKVAVVFTAHSVPTRTIEEGDPYEEQARNTGELVARSLPQISSAETRFAFQSQGTSREPWLGPTVEETILVLKHSGHRGVLIQPIGFLCDHVEVLYDIDIFFRNFAEENGMKLWRTESLNDSAALIAALADVAQTALHSAKATVGKTSAT